MSCIFMAMKVRERGRFLHSIASALDSHAQALIEQGRLEYNTLQPHSSLNYRPPVPEAWLHGGHIFWRNSNSGGRSTIEDDLDPNRTNSFPYLCILD